MNEENVGNEVLTLNKVDLGQLEKLAQIGGTAQPDSTPTTITVSSADCIEISVEGTIAISKFNSCFHC